MKPPTSEIQGRREVAESILTAILTTIATALAQWGMDKLRESREKEKPEGDG